MQRKAVFVEPFQGSRSTAIHPGLRFAYPGLLDKTPLGYRSKSKAKNRRTTAFKGRQHPMNYLRRGNHLAFVERHGVAERAPMMHVR